MNRFFTITLKATVFLFFVVLNSVSVSADEYKSMIRYDRVWECFSTLDGKDYDTIKCMRFDGTEEINGKIYHRIVTFKRSQMISYDYDTEEASYETEDCLEHEGYMREEDGKIYTLVEKKHSKYTNDEGWSSYLLYIPDSFENVSHPNCEECLLYDMNVMEGDYFGCVSFIESLGWNDSFKVLNVSYTEIDGEKCKMMYVCTEDKVEYHETYDTPYYWYHPIVEGIGAVEKGCLNYHEFIDHPSRMYAHNYFSRLLDMDGRVIYPIDFDNNHYGIDYGSFNSVEHISSLNATKDAAMYDVMGRRISSAAPGQLYIQGGKKRIGGRF